MNYGLHTEHLTEQETSELDAIYQDHDKKIQKVDSKALNTLLFFVCYGIVFVFAFLRAFHSFHGDVFDIYNEFAGYFCWFGFLIAFIYCLAKMIIFSVEKKTIDFRTFLKVEPFRDLISNRRCQKYYEYKTRSSFELDFPVNENDLFHPYRGDRTGNFYRIYECKKCKRRVGSQYDLGVVCPKCGAHTKDKDGGVPYNIILVQEVLHLPENTYSVRSTAEGAMYGKFRIFDNIKTGDRYKIPVKFTEYMTHTDY